MGKTKKYYVVWVGVKPGVYQSWAECEAQTKGFPGARYKSFGSMAEAQAAYQGGPTDPSPQRPKVTKPRPASAEAGESYLRKSIAVDAASSGNPGKMEYQGVWTEDKTLIFHQAFPLGTNNIGEFLAIVHALAWCQKEGIDWPIYSDSVNAMNWVRQKRCKTTLVRNAKTAELFNVIARAENWLANNTYPNPILKWQTRSWGEIPADFGRK